LLVVPSPCVEPKVTNLKIDNYKVSYYNELIPADMIGHSKYWNPINGSELPINQLIGMSPLLACRNLLKRYGAADIAQGSMFSNMGPAGVLTGGKDSGLTDVQAKAVQDKFKQYHSGQSKAGSILVTPAELHWTQIGLSPVDLNTIEGKQEILSELCNVYHVPRELFASKDAKFSNKEEARKQLITDAVIPLVEKRKQTINRQLAPLFGEDLIVEYDYSIFEEMQDDLKTKWEWLGKMWELTPNQRLEEAGFDRVNDPNMDKRYVPSGYTPMDEMSMDSEPVDEEEIEGMDS
jgi:HK97 family phage portal protein